MFYWISVKLFFHEKRRVKIKSGYKFINIVWTRKIKHGIMKLKMWVKNKASTAFALVDCENVAIDRIVLT